MNTAALAGQMGYARKDVKKSWRVEPFTGRRFRQYRRTQA